MRQFTIVSLMLFSLCAYAQISFEPGFYIDLNGNKIDCLIKNYDWFKSPETIEVKFDEDSEIMSLSTSKIVEFGIGNTHLYRKKEVKIDKSSSKPFPELGYEIIPKFNEETLLLKLLIKGDINLYEYVEKGTSYYFIEHSNKMEQLIVKKYKTNVSTVGVRNVYKQDLRNLLQCVGLPYRSFENLSYDKNDLVNIMKAYFECMDKDYFIYSSSSDIERFKINLRGYINSASLDLKSTIFFLDEYNISFGNSIGFRIGVELEYLLPFNNDKWSVLFEPSYQTNSFSGSTLNNNDNISLDYSSIDLTFGGRHYFYLNSESSIFLNALLTFDVSNTSKMEFENRDDLDLDTQRTFGFGVGFKYKKIITELRYNTQTELLRSYEFWSAKYNSISFIIGYSIL